MISFYILFKRFFLKLKGLSDARVVSIAKEEYGLAVYFLLKIHKVFKGNIKSVNHYMQFVEAIACY